MQNTQNPIDWKMLKEVLANTQPDVLQKQPQTEIIQKVPLDQININNIFKYSTPITENKPLEVQTHQQIEAKVHPQVQGRPVIPVEQNSNNQSNLNSKSSDLTNMVNLFLHTGAQKHNAIHKQPNQSILYVRDKDGVQMVTELGAKVQNLSLLKDFMVVSRSGELMVVGSTQVLVLFVNNVFEKQYIGQSIQLVDFTPDGNFVLVIDRVDTNNYSLSILDSLTFLNLFTLNIGRFNKSVWPFVHFDSTNSLCFILCQQYIHVYETGTFNKVTQFQSLPNNSQTAFNLSKARESLFISLVEVKQALQQSLQPSKFLVWSYDQPSEPHIETDLETAQQVSQLWSSDGLYLLLWTQLLDDETNKSYYGVHKIYHIDVCYHVYLFPKIKTKEQKQLQQFDGPIYDVAWNSLSDYFIIVGGYMPAGSVLYNRYGEQLYLLNQSHVNTINWSPNGKFVCLGGFGNLAGEMEIWDIRDIKKIGSCKKDKVILFSWADTGEYFLVATTFPRLRVNNMIQIYQLEGTLVYQQDFQELYDVKWKPYGQISPLRILKDHNKSTTTVTQPPHKKTLSLQTANFMKELKGETLVCPLKLSGNQSLKDLIDSKRKQSLDKIEEMVKQENTDQNPKQDKDVKQEKRQLQAPQKPQFTLTRRQTPLEAQPPPPPTEQEKKLQLRSQMQNQDPPPLYSLEDQYPQESINDPYQSLGYQRQEKGTCNLEDFEKGSSNRKGQKAWGVYAVQERAKNQQIIYQDSLKKGQMRQQNKQEQQISQASNYPGQFDQTE